MKIEVFGKFNEDGSSMPLWVYEIDPACERVLVAPYTPRSPARGQVWGFTKEGRQIEGELVHHDPRCFITA